MAFLQPFYPSIQDDLVALWPLLYDPKPNLCSGINPQKSRFIHTASLHANLRMMYSILQVEVSTTVSLRGPHLIAIAADTIVLPPLNFRSLALTAQPESLHTPESISSLPEKKCPRINVTLTYITTHFTPFQ